MQVDGITQFVVLAIFGLLLGMFLGPPLLFGIRYLVDRRQAQHALLRRAEARITYRGNVRDPPDCHRPGYPA